MRRPSTSRQLPKLKTASRKRKTRKRKIRRRKGKRRKILPASPNKDRRQRDGEKYKRSEKRPFSLLLYFSLAESRHIGTSIRRLERAAARRRMGVNRSLTRAAPYRCTIIKTPDRLGGRNRLCRIESEVDVGYKILLADDSATVQKIITLTFSDEGVEVITVNNGDEAIDRLRRLRPAL